LNLDAERGLLLLSISKGKGPKEDDVEWKGRTERQGEWEAQ